MIGVRTVKVGIFTFPNSTSYGAALQMFALYRTSVELGYQTEIIYYHNMWMKKEKHTSSIQKLNKAAGWLKRKIHYLLHLRLRKGFSQFEKQMKRYPTVPFSDKQKLREIGDRYQAVVCGSDQVWNPDITNSDLSYFLNFCGPNTTRISYAPSFGVEHVSDSFGDAIREELVKFDYLSVREEAGQRLIRNLTNQEAQLVIDPTLLMDGNEWTAYESAHPAAKGEYILYYTIRSSDTLWKYCLNLAEKCNMKILRIGSNVISKHFKQSDRVEYVCDVSPNEWLYLVHNASYVVTNSFHGTAFSINYRKNFYVEYSSLTNSRLSNIVTLLGLEQQVVRSEEPSLPLLTDYTQTEKVLPEMRIDSLQFLKRALAGSCKNT